MYFRGQGKVFAAEIAAGAPKAFRFLGNVPELNVAMETETLEHQESTSGNRLTDLRMDVSKNANITVTLEEWTKKNIAEMIYGEVQAITGASVTNEAAPAALAAGDFWRLAHPDISALAITDSAGTPASLTAGTHYRIESARHGVVEILDLASFIQPLKAAYTHAAYDSIAMFKRTRRDLWLLFDGLNTADENRPVRIELYKVSLDPAGEIPLIQAELAGFQLQGTALYDSTKAADTTLGQFGRVLYLV
ncbi:MAG: hypothetical protein IT532_00340 [Burkholderiales bacterium]|nr:hypothetical protein [Burkholderiales bacterium]